MFQLSVTGDITSVHDTANYVSVTTTCCTPAGRSDPRCNPIEVYPDDVHLRRSGIRCLNLTTAITYSRLDCVPDSAPRERINTAAPLLDMSGVYGHSADRALRAREMAGGRLISEVIKGKDWPPSGGLYCVNNEPPAETRCHDAATGGLNSVLGVNIFYIWMFRNHNRIARKLEELNPCWDDDKLYFTAREINIAMKNQIFYYELMPDLAGYEYLVKNEALHETYGHVNDYNPKLMPTVTIDYVTTSRWYHSIQEGRLNLYTKHGRLYDQLAAVDFTLRTGALPINNTLEGITQGSFRQPCGTSEIVVDPDIGERILGRLQRASDVISSDIMKTRDFGMPPYVHYRAACGLPVPKQFKDLLGWMDPEKVEALSLSYESVYDIDIQVGILAERPMPGVALGPTFACISVDQMKRWRQSDRFWYENNQHPGAFTSDQLYEIRKMTVAKLLCDNGDQVDHIQPAAFLVSEKGNELTSCSNIQGPNLEAWRDERCSSKHVHGAGFHMHDPSDIHKDDWNYNHYMGYSPMMSQDRYIPNRDRLMTPWVGVIQPINDKDRRRPGTSDVNRLMNPINGIPSMVNDLPSNVQSGDQIPTSTDIVPEPELPVSSSELSERNFAPQASENIHVISPLPKKNAKTGPVENNKIKSDDSHLRASEIIKTVKNVPIKIRNPSLTQAQIEFLQKLSQKGQPSFEEFGFFAVISK